MAKRSPEEVLNALDAWDTRYTRLELEASTRAVAAPRRRRITFAAAPLGGAVLVVQRPLRYRSLPEPRG